MSHDSNYSMDSNRNVVETLYETPTVFCVYIQNPSPKEVQNASELVQWSWKSDHLSDKTRLEASVFSSKSLFDPQVTPPVHEITDFHLILVTWLLCGLMFPYTMQLNIHYVISQSNIYDDIYDIP